MVKSVTLSIVEKHIHFLVSILLALLSPRPEKRGRESSPPSTASPSLSRPSSPAGTIGATTQQVDVLAKPKVKEPSAAGVIPPLKVLGPKKLPIKKSTR